MVPSLLKVKRPDIPPSTRLAQATNYSPIHPSLTFELLHRCSDAGLVPFWYHACLLIRAAPHALRHGKLVRRTRASLGCRLCASGKISSVRSENGRSGPLEVTKVECFLIKPRRAVHIASCHKEDLYHCLGSRCSPRVWPESQRRSHHWPYPDPIEFIDIHEP